MIVNYTEKGWQIITQRSHGLLAAQICAKWRKDKQPKRWMETLIATAEHDDVFNEFDNKTLLDANGAPLNFKATKFDEGLSEQLMDMAETKSSYIALLISRHIQFVHGADSNATSFIKKLKRQEKTWMKSTNVKGAEIDQSYELLEFCDAFSLLICQTMIQPEGRKIQISNGPDQRQYDMHLEAEKLIVDPWPFEEDVFQVSYESRTLDQLTFKSAREFSTKIKKAKVSTHFLTLSKTGS
jgi:hypothetical protein